jgi:ankyrin repeat protein
MMPTPELNEHLLRAVYDDDDPAEVRRLLQLNASPNPLVLKGIPLVFLCRSTTVLQLLLDYGASPFVRTKNGTSGLHFNREDLVMAETWLELLGDVDVVDNEGESPLFAAVRCNSVHSAQFLLTRGADPNRKSFEGGCMIHVAALCGYRQMMMLLLESGAAVDLTDSHQDTALMIAAWHDSYLESTTIDILLEYGASRIRRSIHGMSALDNALEGGSRRAIRLLSASL